MKVFFSFLLASVLIAGTATAQSDSREPGAAASPAPAIQEGTGIIHSAPVQNAPAPMQASPVAPPATGGEMMAAPAVDSGAACASIASPACGSYGAPTTMSFSDASMGGSACGGYGVGYADDCGVYGGGYGDCGYGAYDGGYGDCCGEYWGDSYGGDCYGGGFGFSGIFGGVWNRGWCRPLWFGRRIGGTGCGY